ncbi:diacylglycerol kinase family protein [uncultured Limosilactobacillus sp.]|uniref:diacylglycerol kinase family protein n=1 Tax=uncultured Limosilactobacillus sp. TaxID=2837629 RepID=UPI0025E8146E|nr:diacylglycerol kinase family protein [uncultured Limosilactobacillus sp.]
MDSPDKQTSKNHRLCQAMRHSIHGIWMVISQERNMRYHIAASVIVIVAGLCFKLLPWEWLWLFLAIFTVFSAEFMNTVAETFCDLMVGHQFNVNVKKIKDVSAGAVLIAALFAVIVGLIIFGPRLIELLGR